MRSFIWHPVYDIRVASACAIFFLLTEALNRQVHSMCLEGKHKTHSPSENSSCDQLHSSAQLQHKSAIAMCHAYVLSTLSHFIRDI